MNKPGKGTVVGPFHLSRETTGRKLVRLEVIGDTLTALASPGTGFIGAAATGFIDINLALH